MLQDGESGGAVASSTESSGMIIRGGAGGDNVSSSGEAGGSTTGGYGSADVSSVLAGTGPGGTTL